MDGQRFDALTRAFATGRSRRAVLKAVVGGAGAATLGLLGLRPSAAQGDCPLGRIACDGDCLDPCPDGSALDAATCLCRCADDRPVCGDACCASEEACVDGACCTDRGGVCRNDAGCCDGLTCCNGRCVDLDTNHAHCGECGAACDADPYLCEAPVCRNGRCATRSLRDGAPCVPGDDTYACCDGACADLYDEATCGGCGGSCRRGETCCRGEGCFDLRTDPDHCGGCFHACDPDETCVRGECCPAAGSNCAGSADCCPGHTCANGACRAPAAATSDAQGVSDGTATPDGSGCRTDAQCGPGRQCVDRRCVRAGSGSNASGGQATETPTIEPGPDATPVDSGLCTDGRPPCGTACCASDLVCCNGACVDLLTDPSHCGGCDLPCDVAGGEWCVEGACCKLEGSLCSGTGECCPGHTCESGVCLSAGTPETDTCPGGEPPCTGACCDPGDRCCDGTCVDPLSDSLHCGDCGIVCDATTGYHCVEGVCCKPDDSAFPCQSPDECCSGYCDPNAVCKPAPDQQPPEDECPPGQTRCAGLCVDLDTDVAHCGACGVWCPAIECTVPVCIQGVCQTEFLADGTPCGNGGCLTNGACQSGVCQGTPVADDTPCADGNPCTLNGVCVGGTCSATEVPNGTPCALDGECLLDATCQDGRCRGTYADAGTPCTAGGCLTDGACRNGRCEGTPTADGTPCDDGNLCTENTVCRAGACVGTELRCPDYDPLCATASCAADRGCTYGWLPDGSACGENLACLEGICTPQQAEELCGGFEVCEEGWTCLGDFCCEDFQICTGDVCCGPPNEVGYSFFCHADVCCRVHLICGDVCCGGGADPTLDNDLICSCGTCRPTRRPCQNGQCPGCPEDSEWAVETCVTPEAGEPICCPTYRACPTVCCNPDEHCVDGFCEPAFPRQARRF